MSDFAHRLTLDRIGTGDRIDLVADEAERKAITERLGLVSLDRLEAHAALTRDGDMIGATGRIKALLCQSCVATGQPVRAHLDESFQLRFVPAPSAAAPDDEVELAADDLDTIFYDGGSIDLGEAIADSLALALDPYPRSAEADRALREAGVIGEEEAGPFAALAALKGKLSGEG